jgi:predicted negative regulator of RcsB-dependent stress response
MARLAATMYQDAGKYPEAAKHLEEAIGLPQKRLNRQMLGDVKLLEKDYHAAKTTLAKQQISSRPIQMRCTRWLSLINS